MTGLEPIIALATWEVTKTAAVSVGLNFAANRTDELIWGGIRLGWKSLLDRPAGDDPLNHNLQRAARGAYLNAARELADVIGSEAAAKEIQKLESRPARNFTDADDKQIGITPDVYVFKDEEKWVVTDNDKGVQRLYINESLTKQLLRDPNAKEFIGEKLRNAQWLIRAIEQRRKTIIRVTECIVEKQRDFFEKGVAFLKPMILRDIAETVGMHESTISRVTTNKYVHTPQGLFELKYFFNSSIRRTAEEDIASESVKQAIKKIIDGEDKASPLSDQAIVEMLSKDDGIQIARRDRHLKHLSRARTDRKEGRIGAPALLAQGRQDDGHDLVIAFQDKTQGGVETARPVAVGGAQEFVVEAEGVEKGTQAGIVVFAEAGIFAKGIRHLGQRLFQMFSDQFLVGNIVRDLAQPVHVVGKTDQPRGVATLGQDREGAAHHGGARDLAKGADMGKPARPIAGFENHRGGRIGAPFDAREQAAGLLERPGPAFRGEGGNGGRVGRFGLCAHLALALYA